MLASYPAAYGAVVEATLAAAQGVAFDRLLCPFDAVPLGAALSLRTGVPLVYSRGSGDQPVNDLIGAYDIGHPALLVTTSMGWEPYPQALVSGAKRVGLEVHAVLTILETRSTAENVIILPLLRMADVVDELEGAGRIPLRQAQAARAWLAG